MHTQNRWHYFHQKAVANGELSGDDVFLPVIATPFGFGIWTTHTTPIHLGATAVLLERFTVAAACEAIERHRVTVLCCVSTQLTMLMADPARRDYDLSSLRVVFTGGEALPYRPAAEFEELTGAKILQFYGSNETGLLSGTTVHDPRERRLRTGGRIVPEMAVRLFDGDEDVTESGVGQPACRGPATSLGYLGGTDHDKLFTRDGWMRMGDICAIDGDGYLSVTGRTSDFIVRGGKNISASQVEDAVTTHPAIAVAAAVAMPDPVFGEKVCVYTEIVGSRTVELPELVEHLLAQGVSKELLPERLIVLDELPRSSGGKIAKGQLREDIRARKEQMRKATDAPDARRGGLEVWAPSVMPPIGDGPLQRTGVGRGIPAPRGHRVRREHGRPHHLAARRPVRHAVNPWGLWWQELTASDICVVDEDAGWFAAAGTSRRRSTSIPNCTAPAPTPASSSTTTLTTCACWPRWAHCRTWSTRPARCSSTTCAWSRNTTVKSTVPPAQPNSPPHRQCQSDDPGQPRRHRHRPQPAEAVYRAASIERVCKLAYDVMLTNQKPVEMKRSDLVGMQASLIERAADVYWAGAARMTIKADPDVLS